MPTALDTRIERLERVAIPSKPRDPAFEDVLRKSAEVLDATLGPTSYRLHVESCPYSGANGRHYWCLYDVGRAAPFLRLFSH